MDMTAEHSVLSVNGDTIYINDAFLRAFDAAAKHAPDALSNDGKTVYDFFAHKLRDERGIPDTIANIDELVIDAAEEAYNKRRITQPLPENELNTLREHVWQLAQTAASALTRINTSTPALVAAKG